jgi:hypothetical protein
LFLPISSCPTPGACMDSREVGMGSRARKAEWPQWLSMLTVPST